MRKLFSLIAAVLFAGSMMADSYTITFKEGSGTDSDSGTKISTVADIISDGASYVSEVATATNVYNARIGRGIKLGTSKAVGELTLTLATPVNATSIVVTARKYNDTEKSFTIQGSDFTAGDGNEFAEYTYTYDVATEISSIALTSPKRIYFTSVTVNYEAGEVPPTPEVVAPYCQTEVGHFFADNADPNSFVLLSIGAANGKTIVRIDQDAAKNTQMFDFLQVTNLASTGEDVAEGGVTAMAVEFDTPAAVDDSITLEILWSTVGWPGRWMVQNVKVPATAECEYAVLVPEPVEAMSLTQFLADKPTTEVTLKDLTVIFATNKSTYVIDEDGVALVMYDANKTYYDGTLTAGKVLSGQKATYYVNKNQDEIIPTNAVEATDGVAPVPTLLTEKPTDANINRFISYKNVEATANNNKYYIFEDVQLYGATSDLKPTAEGNYDVEGIYIVYNGTAPEIIVTGLAESSPTAISNTAAENKAEKIMRNGMILIVKGDKTYNVMGQIVK